MITKVLSPLKFCDSDIGVRGEERNKKEQNRGDEAFHTCPRPARPLW